MMNNNKQIISLSSYWHNKIDGEEYKVGNIYVNQSSTAIIGVLSMSSGEYSEVTLDNFYFEFEFVRGEDITINSL